MCQALYVITLIEAAFFFFFFFFFGIQCFQLCKTVGCNFEGSLTDPFLCVLNFG